MHVPLRPDGTQLLIVVTVAALAIQALKLGSRGVMLGQWPAAGQWAQLGLVVWLLSELWNGKSWARTVTMWYYTAMALVGVLVLYVMWPESESVLRVVSVVNIVLSIVIACGLALQGDARSGDD